MGEVRNRFVAALAVAVPALVASAQTTGVRVPAPINDLTVNGCCPGQRSCSTANVPNGPPITLSVACRGPAFASTVVFVVSFCRCSACRAQLNPSSCPIPMSACFCSNQSVDLDLSANCNTLTFLGLVLPQGADGVASVVLPFPAFPVNPGFLFSVQAGVLDSGCRPPGFSAVVTQAYDVFVQ